MKSREEYEASIFAKRDALLAKRKKNLRMAATALSVIICLGAVAVAIPIMNKKPDEAALPSATNAASGITENKIVAEMFDEAATNAAGGVMINRYDTEPFEENREMPDGVEEGECITFFNDFCISETIQHQHSAAATEIEIAPEDTADELFTHDKQFAYNPAESKPAFDASEAPKPSTSKKTYTTEEITAKAESYLAESDADKIIADKTNAVVSRKSDGTTSYTVYFYTADKKITVNLDGNLELIEIKEKDNSGGVTQIAPAYNPNA